MVEIRPVTHQVKTPRVDGTPMDVSPVDSSLGGVVAAQMMFAVTANAAATVQAPDASGDAGASTSDVGVAVLKKALDAERSLVNILA